MSKIYKMLLGGIVFLFALSVNRVRAAEWCYQSQVTCNHSCTGPDVWGTVSQQCGGKAQSPINIVTRNMLPDDRLTAFQFHGYQETFHSRLVNNGHTVQLDLPPGKLISGGNLSSNYKAVQLHMHWGRNGGPGSEHTIDGERFPMEMHIVHMKQEYDSLSQAVKDRTGVAVLAFLFQVSESSNKKYAGLISALEHIIEPSSSIELSDVSLDMFIPPERNMTAYMRYHGSLTTPDCAESVIWSLFEGTIPLSRNQLSAFCQLRFADRKQMVETYRPVQPLNGRQVYHSEANVSLFDPPLLLISVLFSSALSW